MPKPVYKIPLLWLSSSEVGRYADPLMVASDMKVFLVPDAAPRVLVDEDLLAERAPLRPGVMRFLYEPGSFARDEVSYKRRERHYRVWFEGKMVPVSRAKYGQRVLAFIDGTTPRLCGARPGTDVLHTIIRYDAAIRSDQVFHLTYECNEPVKYDATPGVHFEIHQHAMPTCPECKEGRWRQFYVNSHDVSLPEYRAMVEKTIKKDQYKERRFMARPTRFDRVAIDEDAPKPQPVVLAPVEAEEEEPRGRDGKLAARVRQGQVDRVKRETFKRERRWR